MHTDKKPHEITLEQLTKHLRKVVTKPYDVKYLEELIKRVETSYLETLDKTQVSVSSNVPWGWHEIKELQHVREGSTVLFYFPYGTVDDWTCFDYEKHGKKELPLNFCRYVSQGGYEVLGYKHYDGKFYAGANRHMITEQLTIELDVTKAQRFALFGSSYSNLLRESVLLDNRRLRDEVEKLKAIAERKNLELDALGLVWCTGKCQGGQFAFTEPQEITEEMLHMVALVALRLITRGSNTNKLPEKMKHYIDGLERYAKRFERHDVQAFINKAKAMLNSVHENAAAVIAQIKKEI